MIRNVLNSEDDQGVLFNEVIPSIPEFDGLKSVLQCGARQGDGWQKIFKGFQRNGFMRFEILEIFQRNVNWLRTQRAWPCPIHSGDIRHIGDIKSLQGKEFDVVTFWHGPEHISQEEFEDVLVRCKEHLKAKFFIAGAPWGKWEQGNIFDNPHEVHVRHWYPEEWEAMGFDVWTFNDPEKKPGPDNHNVMFGVKRV